MDTLYLSMRNKIEKDFSENKISSIIYENAISMLHTEYPTCMCKNSEDFNKMKHDIYEMCNKNMFSVDDREEYLIELRSDMNDFIQKEQQRKARENVYKREKESIYKEYTDGNITLGEREAKLLLARKKLL